MRKISSFDPSLSSNGVIHTYGVNKNEQLVLYNDSPIGLELTFNDNSIIPIPAGWAKDVILRKIPMGDIGWSQQYVLNVTGYPTSIVYGEIREDTEHVNSVNQSIPRSTVVGNPGGLNVSTQTLFNNGGVAPTQIISVGVLNEGTATYTAYNDGTIEIFLRTASNTYTQVMRFNIAEPYAQIGAQAHDLELWGHLINRDTYVPFITAQNVNVSNVTLLGGANDSRGIIQFDVINAPIAGGTTLFTVNFGRAFTTYTPAIVLSSASNQTTSNFHHAGDTMNGFNVYSDTSIPVIAHYKVSYHVIG